MSRTLPHLVCYSFTVGTALSELAVGAVHWHADLMLCYPVGQSTLRDTGGCVSVTDPQDISMLCVSPASSAFKRPSPIKLVCGSINNIIGTTLLWTLQVGEFYETMGTDAVLLVQHAGLNPMGQGDPPRAGCPIANLRRTISDLVEQAGLSVVTPFITPPHMFCSMARMWFTTHCHQRLIH